MIVLIETDNAQASGLAGAAVISRFHGQPGCMNTAFGGEGNGLVSTAHSCPIECIKTQCR